ncbi:MAG: NAD(P)/FAD-dependent oxidoreductase [Mycolicibacterium insubricum]
MDTAKSSPSVAIVGAGFGGLGMAVKFKQAGITDLTLFEKASDVGGVWRDNDYPGAACDVPSHLYSFSFAPYAEWSRRFAPRDEIYDYLRHCARSFGIYPHIRFDTEVTGASFDEEAGEWVIELAGGGGTHRATVLITATGQLSRPAYPRIPGLDSFAGTMFHSATWDHHHDLTGEKVAVIGTGASAIQFVPPVAAQAAHLELFQRGAAHVLPKPDYPYPKPVRKLFRRIPALLRLSRWVTYAELEPRALAFVDYPQALRLYEFRFRRHLARDIRDPRLREQLTPTDPMGCKRILLSNDYYEALARDNVSLVTEPITAVVPQGLVTADGVLHEADTIILGTGFAATDFLAPMQITGRGGTRLNDVWRDGAEAYLGLSVSGFPNFFMLYGPNTNLSHSSIVYMLEAQMGHVLDAVGEIRRRGLKWLEVRPDVLSEFNMRIQHKLDHTVWAENCSSWYRTAAGKNTQNWPGFTFAYRAAAHRLRESDYDFVGR